MKKYTYEEFLNEFGDFLVQLTSYYKFSFSYSGEMNGKKIYLSVGGNSDVIYEFEPLINAPTPIQSLLKDPGINYALIYENDVQVGEYRNSSW